MPTFKCRISRTATETTFVVVVEADNAQEANLKAFRLVDGNSRKFVWSIDEGGGDAYIPDINRAEEVEAPGFVYTPTGALRQIIKAHGYRAEHGHYPDGLLRSDQSFDDWVADLAKLVFNKDES